MLTDDEKSFEIAWAGINGKNIYQHTVCICSSMAFYREFLPLKEKLEAMNFVVHTPDLEFESSDDVAELPSNHEFWKKKGATMKKHFRKVAASDAILVVNLEKKGVHDYIGANTFLEIGYAFSRNIPICLLNAVPKPSGFTEELRGMQVVELKGDLKALKEHSLSWRPLAKQS